MRGARWVALGFTASALWLADAAVVLSDHDPAVRGAMIAAAAVLIIAALAVLQ